MSTDSFRNQTVLERNLEVKLSILDIAQCWCQMDSDQQAEFFEAVADISESWPPSSQLEVVQLSPRLTPGETLVRS